MLFSYTIPVSIGTAVDVIATFALVTVSGVQAMIPCIPPVQELSSFADPMVYLILFLADAEDGAGTELPEPDIEEAPVGVGPCLWAGVQHLSHVPPPVAIKEKPLHPDDDTIDRKTAAWATTARGLTRDATRPSEGSGEEACESRTRDVARARLSGSQRSTRRQFRSAIG